LLNPQDYLFVPRLSVPLTDEQHRAIRTRADALGVPLAEITRRLLLLWLIDDLELPQGDNYRALVDAAVSYYAERGT
jgi:hypothetical protein